jgi:hypothetical protein
MSRTYKDEIQQCYDLHPEAPYWKYGWAYKHGCSHTRRIHNRMRRAQAKQALREGRDAPKEVKYLPWVWW